MRNLRPTGLRMGWLLVLGLAWSPAQEYTDAFLRIGSYPRSISLGQAVVALPGYAGGLSSTPAALGFIPTPVVYAMAVDQFGLANFFSAGGALPVSPLWQVGGEINTLIIDNIPRRPDLRLIQDLEVRRDSIRTLVARGFETFHDRESALFLSVTRNIQTQVDLGWQIASFSMRIPLGLTVKGIHKELYSRTGNGIGLDLGAMVILDLPGPLGKDWLGELSTGIVIKDLFGTGVYWNTGKTDLIPARTVAGLGYRQSFKAIPVALVLLIQSDRQETAPQLGLEMELYRLVRVRCGSRDRQLQGGVGLEMSLAGHGLSLDYSFAAHALGDLHRIGSSIVF